MVGVQARHRCGTFSNIAALFNTMYLKHLPMLHCISRYCNDFVQMRNVPFMQKATMPHYNNSNYSRTHKKLKLAVA